jgi:magnesium transporter
MGKRLYTIRVMSQDASLLPLVQKSFEIDPSVTALTLEAIDESKAAEVLSALPPEMASQVVRHLNDAFAANLLQRLPYPLFRRIVENLDSHQGASIFFHFPNHVRQLFLLQLEGPNKRAIQEILTFPVESAGRLMTKDYLAFHNDIKVRDAIEILKKASRKGAGDSYVYVIDQKQRLVGILNMREVIVADHDARLEAVMNKDVVSVNCFMDRDSLAKELTARNYFALPVIDSEHRLLGIVRARQILDNLQEGATEDLQKMFGAGADERVFSSIGFSLKKRLPWLHVNLATAFLAASVVALFEDIIAKITVLAIYLPVVAGQGGNSGAQSLAVVMRGLVMREIPPQKVKKLVIKETAVGALAGVIIGVVTALVAWLWQSNPFLGVVIGLGMLVNLTIAGLTGAAIPLLMKKVGLDPAQCSNIILTTITDVMGFFAFLGFAVLFQSYLI